MCLSLYVPLKPRDVLCWQHFYMTQNIARRRSVNFPKKLKWKKKDRNIRVLSAHDRTGYANGSNVPREALVAAITMCPLHKTASHRLLERIDVQRHTDKCYIMREAGQNVTASYIILSEMTQSWFDQSVHCLNNRKADLILLCTRSNVKRWIFNVAAILAWQRLFPVMA